MPELATGWVSIVPSTKGFDKKLRDELRGQDVDIDVDADTTSASASLSRWRATEGHNKVSLKVDVDTNNASNELRGMRRDIEMLGRSDALRLNIGAAAITGLPMLASGLAEVAGGLQQVAQAGLAVPGALAGAAASVGTLTFGLTGIKDAYDALGKASDDAASSGSSMASQARAQQSAEFSLRNAVMDTAQARKDVAQATRDARRELVDLNVEMRGGVLNEKRAVLEAQRAREDLAKGGFQSASDFQDAMLRVEEADQRVLEVRARNAETAEKLTDANAKGVAGSDRVVAANEQLARSQQQVTLSQAALVDSAPAASAAQENAAVAMGKLSANGREFVSTLRDITDGPGMDLRNLVQDNIFAGLAGQLRGFSTKALPTFRDGLGGISEAWNDTFTEMFNVLGRDDNLSLVDRIFGNTADAQTRLNDAIDPLVEGIGTLAAAGSDSLPRLADAFVTVSDRFSNFITRADADGSLAKWIDDGITGLGHLGQTALNIGKMFTAITNAAGPSTLLQDIATLTDKWQGFLNSAQGQQTLQNVFAEGKDMFEKWKPILEDMPSLFKGFYDAASQYMGLFLPIVDRITSLMADHPRLVQLAADAYLVFKGAQVVGAIGTLADSLNGINNILGTPGGKGGVGGKGMLGRLALAGSLFAALEIGATNPALTTGPGEAAPDGSSYNISPDGKITITGPDGKPAKGLLTPGPPDYGPSWGPTELTKPGPGSGAPLLDILNGKPAAAGSQPRSWQDLFSVPGSSSGGTGAGSPLLDILQGKTPAGEGASFGGAGLNVDAMLALAQATSGKVKYAPASDLIKGLADCSGSISDLYEVLTTGKTSSQRMFTTVNFASDAEAAKLGFRPGYMPGALNVGVNPYPGNSGHMAATLPNGVNYEGGGGTGGGGQYGGSASGALDPQFEKRYYFPIPGMTYDTGGPLPPGQTLVNNQTGKPEFVLTPEDIEYLRKNGIDPASIQNQALNLLPSQALNPEQQVDAWAQPQSSNRTEGYIPAAAGNTGKTGGGIAGSFINMGTEALNGLIDQAAGAASMGANAFAPGSGMAISMGAQAAKRLVQYGGEMANIGIGAATEILSPFGAPRWLTDVDPTSFMPQQGIMPAAVTTGERSAVDPNTTQHGAGNGAPPGPVAPTVPQPPVGPNALSAVAQQATNIGPVPQPAMVHVDTINTADAQGVGAEIAKRQRLEAMRFNGRP